MTYTRKSADIAAGQIEMAMRLYAQLRSEVGPDHPDIQPIRRALKKLLAVIEADGGAL